MKDAVKVSVIMTTYKTPRRFLDIAINSILVQTYKNFELIIVCDGDKEEYEYIKKYDDKRIKLIFHNENLGISKSANDGLKNATGKYIMRMDADDVSLRDRMEKQVYYMENHENIDISYMQSLSLNKSVKIMDTYNNTPLEIEIQLLYMNPITHSAVMIRNNFLDKNKILYNENYKCSVDYELWAKSSKNANIAEIHKIGVLYRVHDSQISNQKRQLQKELKEKIIKDYNIRKIKDDDKTLEALLFLTGSIEVNNKNYSRFIEDIEYIIKYNEKYDKKVFKKVISNMYFQMITLDPRLRKHLITFLKEKRSRKMIFTTNNLKYISVKLLKIVKTRFYRIKYSRCINQSR